MITEKQQKIAAAAFAKRWEGKGYEKGESQTFWIELLTQIFDIETPSEFIKFEEKAHLDHTSFVDAMIHSTHVMIEQKSLGKNLRQPIKQADGTPLTPFEQAQRYRLALPYSQQPRWIVTCNFAEFDIYDMENPNGEPSRILLKDLEREFYRLDFLVKQQGVHLQKELEVSMKAGEIVGKLYICDVPKIGIGNKPIDGGNYLFEKEDHLRIFMTQYSCPRNFFWHTAKTTEPSCKPMVSLPKW